ncbi:hypothetical protein [Aureibacter tunicatorum]|uniref:Uncharacterized protein n=1 Tax=Aureibacter tunicatorum TaxID=866807 RepID=A0AAE4BTT1_9BACT|nr:hypothetical protein [Aureibacter tunicatorum]MDR6241031.1 hypothetical protein [Aureibacter tunicatorum]BDD03809.1 hypothetical protein AUTU_12920 [Aureibacter tunicatorum]
MFSPASPTYKKEQKAPRGKHLPANAIQKMACHPPMSVPNQTPIQRKIGFELEGQWNVRDLNPDHVSQEFLEEEFTKNTQARESKIDDYIASNPHLHKMGATAARGMAELTLMQKNEIHEAPLRGANLAKKDPIFFGRDFILEADNSPSGGSNIEFVTSPLDTKSEVDRTAKEIQKIVAEMNRYRAKDHLDLNDRFFQQLNVEGHVPASRHFRLYPLQGELSLQPQFTCGFKLHELFKVIQYLNKNEGKSSHPTPRKLVSAATGEGTDPLQDLQRSHEGATKFIRMDIDTTDSMDSSMLVPDIEWAFPQLRNLHELLNFGFQESDSDQVDFSFKLFGKGASSSMIEQQALIALVSLIVTYLIRAENLPENANAKAIAGGLLCRTNFAHNFTLLSPAYQERFIAHPSSFAELCLKAAGMEGQEEKPLYPHNVRYMKGEEAVFAPIRLTRGKWLESIVGGTDLLNHQFEEAIHPSLGALGDQDGIERSASASEHLLVAEFRRIQATIFEPEIVKTLLGYFNFYEKIRKK